MDAVWRREPGSRRTASRDRRRRKGAQVQIGVPRERKADEYRVAVTPAGTRELVDHGHCVLVERGAGDGSAIPDQQYAATGARIVDDPDELWAASELVCKVKEPVPEEYHRLSLRTGQTLFTYLHLAASRATTQALLASGNTAIAYETVQEADGTLPLLAPMSEIAGRMAPLVGAYFLQRPEGGRGILASGVPGVRRSRVAVLGAGVAGMSAVALAAGIQAEVTVLDRDLARLRHADHIYGGRVQTMASTGHAVEEVCLDADLVVGAILVVGARAPMLVTDDLVDAMRPGSVLVDIAVDQGGCMESSRPTTHSDPVFAAHGSLFYCVANMPGAVPHTATHALSNATLPYTLEIAAHGWQAAAHRDPVLAAGVNVARGAITCAPVAAAHQMPYTALDALPS